MLDCRGWQWWSWMNQYHKGSNQLPLATDDFPAEQKVCPCEKNGSCYNYRVTLERPQMKWNNMKWIWYQIKPQIYWGRRKIILTVWRTKIKSHKRNRKQVLKMVLITICTTSDVRQHTDVDDNPLKVLKHETCQPLPDKLIMFVIQPL